MSRRRQRQSQAFLGLTAYWLAQALLVDPRGEFPLNDDAFYSHAVRRLLEDGTLELHPAAQAAAVAHVAWGALFCTPFGFSFTGLRVSGLMAGWVGVLAMYGLLQQVGRSQRAAVLGAFLLATNPLYLALSHSFMTDVPFLAFATLSLLVLGRAVRVGGTGAVLAGTALSSAAVLIRQVGVSIPLAFGCVYLVRHGLTKRRLLLAILPISTTFAVLMVWEVARRGAVRIPAENWLLDSLGRSPLVVLSAWAAHGMVAIVYLGLWLFPLLVAHRIRITPLGLACGFAFALVTAEALVFTGRLMPLSSNILHPAGLGAPTLRAAELWAGLPRLSSTLWACITALGVAGGTILVALAGSVLHRCWRRRRLVAGWAVLWRPGLALAACAVCAPFLLLGHFDRYLLPALPPLALLACRPGWGSSGSRILASVAACLAYACFGIAATHDYLAWNRARWEAVNGLLRRPLAVEEIDGGYELSLWTRMSGGVPSDWTQPARARFVVALGPVVGYREITRVPYQRWLGSAPGYVVVLNRESDRRATVR